MKKNKTSSSMVLKVAAMFFIIMAISLAKSIVLPLLLSIFISIICIQPIIFLVRKRVPYSLALVIILISVSVSLISLGGVVGSSLSSFLLDLPQYEANLFAIVGLFINKLNGLGLDIDVKQLLNFINPKSILSFTSVVAGNLGEILSNSFLVILITVFILLEAPSFVDKAEIVERFHGTSIQHLEKVGKSVRQYLSIKTVVSILTGLFIWLWLWVVGVDYAILWGVIAFLLNYIPNVGSIIAAIPTLLLALVQLGISGFLWTGLGYLLANFVMGNIVEPKVLGRGLGLSTLVVLLSLVFWGFILGPVGMFLSVPLTITIKIMLEHNEKTKWIAVLLS